MYPVMKIAKMQFDSLMKTPVSYLLLDLRDSSAEPKFPRSTYVQPENAIAISKEKTKSPLDPIIVICQDGSISSEVAEKLSQAGHNNVVLLEGGVSWES